VKTTTTQHSIYSEREREFTFDICRRKSVCRLSVTFVRPSHKIFGNVLRPLKPWLSFDMQVKFYGGRHWGTKTSGRVKRKRGSRI